jgi:hypothetical protein
MLIAGPEGMLATARTENSWSDFWAMTVVADGAAVTGSTVSGVAEEEKVRDLFFHRNASGLGMKFSGREKPIIHYPVFIHNRRNT